MAADFDMLWLLFRTLLPQIGGVALMLARRCRSPLATFWRKMHLFG
jgi:hypothetical protein